MLQNNGVGYMQAASKQLEHIRCQYYWLNILSITEAKLPCCSFNFIIGRLLFKIELSSEPRDFTLELNDCALV